MERVSEPEISEIVENTRTSTRTQQFEVALATLKLVKANFGLDGHARPRIAKIRVIAGNNCESLSSRLPGEIGDGVCTSKPSVKMLRRRAAHANL